MAIHVFRAKVQRMVNGMEDTAVVAVPAPDVESAREEVISKEEGDTTYTMEGFITDLWPGRDTRPSHSRPEYLGTIDELTSDGPVNISEL